MAGLIIYQRQALVLAEATKLLPEEYRDTHIPFRLKADKQKEEGFYYREKVPISGVVHFRPRYQYQNPTIIVRLQMTHQRMVGDDNQRFLTEVQSHTIEIWESVQGLFDVPLGFEEHREEVMKEIRSLSPSHKAVLKHYEEWEEKQNPIFESEACELSLVAHYVFRNGMTADTEWIKGFYLWIISSEGKMWAMPEGVERSKSEID